MAERLKAFVLKTKMGNHRGFEPHSYLKGVRRTSGRKKEHRRGERKQGEERRASRKGAGDKPHSTGPLRKDGKRRDGTKERTKRGKGKGQRRGKKDIREG